MLGKRLEKLDWLLIAFSIVGSCVFGYALWNESWVLRYFITQHVGTQEIGQIKSSSNDVRRRLSRSLTWYDADSKETLYEKDSIFTGDMSEVEMLLLDQQSFRLGSNSLVVLKTDGQDIMLDLQLGSFTGQSDGNKPFKVVQNGNIAKVFSKPKGKAIRFAKNDFGDIELVTGADEVEVQLNSQTEKASGREIIRINKNHQLEKRTVPIKLTGLQAEHWVKPSEPVPLSWQADEGIGRYKIEASRDREMSPDKIEKSVESSEMKVDFFDLKYEGNYYYRVSAVENPEIKSSIGNFERFVKAPLVLLFPTNGLALIPDSELKAEEAMLVRFRWQVRPTLRDYQFELSGDEAMTNIMQTQNLSEGRFSLSLVAGQYFWRVKAPLPDGDFLTSSIYKFEVKGAAPAVTEPVATDPVLIKENLLKASAQEAPEKIVLTEPKKVVVLKSKKGASARNLASVYDGLVNRPEIEWDSAVPAKFYQVEVSDMPDFIAPLVLEPLVDTAAGENPNQKNKLKVKWNEPIPGEYYYRVKALGTKDGNLLSGVGEMRVELAKVGLTPAYNESEDVEDPAQLDIVTKSFAFDWASHPLADAYRFTVSDVKGEVQFEKTLRQSRYTYQPSAPGEYKVAVVPLYKTEVAGQPDEVTLKYEKNLLTRIPAAVLPLQGTTVVTFGSQQGSPILFEWKPVQYASGYELQIASEASFEKPIRTAKVSETSAVIKKIDAQGRIYWRLRTRYTEDKFSDWSVPEFFDQQTSK